MKIFVKTLKGTHFEIELKPEDTVFISFSLYAWCLFIYLFLFVFVEVWTELLFICW